MKILKGISASPGIVAGKAMLLSSEEYNVHKRLIPKKDIPKEIMRLEDSLIKTRKQILRIQQEIAVELGREHAEIFEAHLMVLEDRTLIEDVVARIKKERLNIEYVFSQVIRKYTKAFSKIGDDYLRERVADVHDVGRRVLRNLMGDMKSPLEDLRENVIIISYDLSPSDTVTMHKKNVLGFATDIGGPTSHTAIMAKSLEIPAVVGLEQATHFIREGDYLIIDGSKGIVYINPDAAAKKRYFLDRRRYLKIGRSLQKLRDLDPQTVDGHRVALTANIELPREIDAVLAHGANGIGLYRTEYLYVNKEGMPTEDEQFNSYKEVVTRMKPHSVVLRTLDLGGDKFLSQLNMPREMNPFLGWRAIRFCLANPKVFKTQLRAILRASAFGNVRVMYPLISGVEELVAANKFLEEAKRELKRRCLAFDDKIQVGAMIEIPSAAMTCDLLAKEVDFFSIGTNDLIQYALAADRVNEKVAYLYDPVHPAVIRLIHKIISTGHAEQIKVAMCGEMASDPELCLLLVGFGLDKLSVSPVMIPEIKQIIRTMSFKDAQRISDHVLQLASSKKVRDYLKRELKRVMKDNKLYTQMRKP